MIRLADIVGQKEAVARLKGFAELYSATGGTPENVLIVGEEGIGRETIGLALANERNLRVFSVDAEKWTPGSAIGFLTNPDADKALLLRGIHRLPKPVRVILLTALRDHRLKIHWKLERKLHSTIQRRFLFKNGAGAPVPPFTLIATSTKKTSCPAELLSFFSLIVSPQPYSQIELQEISRKIATEMGVEIDSGSCELVASSCHGRPYEIKLLLDRLARTVKQTAITAEDTLKVFAAFGLAAPATSPPNSSLDLSQISGVDFERVITDFLNRMGFRAEMTRTTGDGGIDIVAVLNRPILGGKYLFQCKRYAPDNLVGAAAVRDFYGAVTAERAIKGIFITTSDFTQQAREFGERVGLELINLQQLLGILAHAQGERQISEAWESEQ